MVMKILAFHFKPFTTTMTVVLGDFNYVEEHEDRYCESAGEWTGNKDRAEASRASGDPQCRIGS